TTRLPVGYGTVITPSTNGLNTSPTNSTQTSFHPDKTLLKIYAQTSVNNYCKPSNLKPLLHLQKVVSTNRSPGFLNPTVSHPWRNLLGTSTIPLSPTTSARRLPSSINTASKSGP